MTLSPRVAPPANARASGPVRFELRVRYHECDVQGIVFNAVYLAWADMACFELWRAACGEYRAITDRGYDTVVVSTATRHHRPARYDDVLQLEVAVGRVGNTSFELVTEIRRDGELLARANVAYVFVHGAALEPTPPPADVRRLLLDCMAAA